MFRKYLFFLSFLEGSAVMASELLGAKMIAPFFGGSMYVWAAVLGVTLFALMSGYYFGGYISQKIKRSSLVYWVLMISGLFLIIMPYTSIWIMEQTINMDIRLGATLSLMVFMFPPLLFMGMTSPILINMINKKVDSSGRSAGSIYAISTLGGILATFLVGFYLLPEFGIKWPCFVFGLLLILFPLMALIKNKSYTAILILIPVILMGFVNSQKVKKQSKNIKLRYSSEGVMGQIRVYDMPFRTFSRGYKNARVLMVNNTAQTLMDRDNPEYDVWDWSYYFPTAASIFPEGSEALLLGLGGGTLVQQFKRLDFNLDVVEIDKRIKDVAIEYFHVDPKTNIMIDDARHFININQKKYDIVTLDLFLNETPPSHVLTKESFQKIKSFLNPNGLIMMNFYGYLSGDIGKASRCVYKTFKSAGFHCELFVTPGSEGGRNLIFLASHKPLDFTKTSYSEPGLPALGNITKNFVNKNLIDFSDAEVLTDKIPRLDKIYLEAAVEWRKASIKYNLKKMIDHEFELIK